MKAEQKIAVIQAHTAALRAELDARMGSNNTIWRAGLAGLGGVILLKQDLDLNRALFLCPILGVLLASHSMHQLYCLYAIGHALAVDERRINALASDTLLSYEGELCRKRAFGVARYSRVLWWAFVPLGLLFWWLEWRLLPHAATALKSPLLELIVIPSCLAVSMIATASLWKLRSICNLLQAEWGSRQSFNAI